MTMTISSSTYETSPKHNLKLPQTLIRTFISGYFINRYYYWLPHSIPLSKSSNHFMICQKQAQCCLLLITRTTKKKLGIIESIIKLVTNSVIFSFACNNNVYTAQPDLVTRKREPSSTFLYLFSYSLPPLFLFLSSTL